MSFCSHPKTYLDMVPLDRNESVLKKNVKYLHDQKRGSHLHRTLKQQMNRQRREVRRRNSQEICRKAKQQHNSRESPEGRKGVQGSQLRGIKRDCGVVYHAGPES